MIQDAIWKTYIDIAAKACEAGDHALSERMLQSAKEEATQLETSPFAEAISNLAYVHYQRGKFRRAELVLRNGLQMYEKVLGSSHPQVTKLMLSLAEFYLSRGNNKSARVMYERYVKAIEALHGSSYHLLEGPLSQLAYLNTKRGRFETAQLFYVRAVKIRLSR